MPIDGMIVYMRKEIGITERENVILCNKGTYRSTRCYVFIFFENKYNQTHLLF